MADKVRPGYKETEFGRGIAVDAAWVLLAFQSDDWRVQCCAMFAVAATNVSYNFNRSKQKEAAIVAAGERERTA